MSFRRLLAIPALTLAACHADVERGPERSRESVFSYSAPMQAGQTVALRNFSGTITITPASDDTLRVVADLHWRGDSTMPRDVNFRGGTMADGVVVCAIIGRSRCTQDDYEVTSDGRGFSFGRGRVRLGMGGKSYASARFRAEVPAGVRLDLVLIDGTIVSSSSAPVKARGVNGNISIATSVGPVQAKTVNGNLDVRMTSLANADSVIVETINGKADAYLAADASISADVRVTSGSALTDFPGLAGGAELAARRITGVLGAGTTPVRVHSINGSAQLRRLDASGRPFPLSSETAP